MAFSFAQELEAAKSVVQDNSKLSALVLGPSGSGKSTLAGTYKGGKILFLNFRAESHGASAAKMYGKDRVTSICVDFQDGEVLKPGIALKRLSNILESADEIKKAGFKLIVIDGATEVEALIKASPAFHNLVGGNDFKKTDVMIDMMRSIILKLYDLQQAIGIDYMVTCPLEVKELNKENGEIMDSQPKLVGYRVAESLVQLFPDVMVVGAMSNGSKTAHRLQFSAGVSKQQKDSVTGGIKRSTNFRPRLTGVNLEEALPDHGTLPADLDEIIKIKKGS